MSLSFKIILYDTYIKKYCWASYRTETSARKFYKKMLNDKNAIPILITQDERVKEFFCEGL